MDSLLQDGVPPGYFCHFFPSKIFYIAICKIRCGKIGAVKATVQIPIKHNGKLSTRKAHGCHHEIRVLSVLKF